MLCGNLCMFEPTDVGVSQNEHSTMIGFEVIDLFLKQYGPKVFANELYAI